LLLERTLVEINRLGDVRNDRREALLHKAGLPLFHPGA
jgi:hypothetical protein